MSVVGMLTTICVVLSFLKVVMSSVLEIRFAFRNVWLP